MSFTIGSLFDGSGGFPLAASMCGGTPKWASEIEPYPIAVTTSRFPNVKHLGSVTDINGGEVEPVDVITFGSPCQDLSVAGKRAGLKHEANGDEETTRSGLFMEAVRIIKEMREATNGVYPRFALWENVPGAFSSNKGEDFRIVLEELIKVVEPAAVMPEVPKNGWPYADSYCGDGWSIAYRVLDAQFWGVPQRRRRIYLVADFRGECAREVLFEREGLRGYFETSRTPWQTAAGDAEDGSGAANCERNCVGFDTYNMAPTGDVSVTLRAGSEYNYAPVFISQTIAVDQGGGKSGANFHTNLSPTLTCTHGGEPVVCYDARGNGDGNIAPTITGDHNNRVTDYTAPCVEPTHTHDLATMNTLTNGDRHAVCYTLSHGGFMVNPSDDNVADTLQASDYKDPQVIAFDRAFFNQGQNALYEPQFYTDGTVPTLVAKGPSGVCVRYIVRRLTPTECARLQGFPDTWGHPIEKTELTDEEYQFWLKVRNTNATINDKATKEYTKEQILKWYNGLHTDSSEYKMWGNGIALPNALYVMQGIADVMDEEKASRKKWLDDLLGGCL